MNKNEYNKEQIKKIYQAIKIQRGDWPVFDTVHASCYYIYGGKCYLTKYLFFYLGKEYLFGCRFDFRGIEYSLPMGQCFCLEDSDERIKGLDCCLSTNCKNVLFFFGPGEI